MGHFVQKGWISVSKMASSISKVAICLMVLAVSLSEARIYSEVQVSKSLFLYAKVNDVVQDQGNYFHLEAGKNQVYILRQDGSTMLCPVEADWEMSGLRLIWNAKVVCKNGDYTTDHTSRNMNGAMATAICKMQRMWTLAGTQG